MVVGFATGTPGVGLRPGLIYTLDASCPCLPAEIWPFFCRRPGLDAGRTLLGRFQNIKLSDGFSLVT